ncbi:efflux RND transporter periplasmic adaptor subunit [Clostridium thailandense]|uniref:efflux RND transporter periplasmic adaptor subunit n=1 Tax=Clostridium thailandense TaxID=2794346 RepID=UPI0039895C0F
MNFKNLNIKCFNKKNLIFIIVVGVAIVLAFSGIRTFTKNKKVETKQEIKNVRTQKITSGSISANVEYAGTLKPAKEVAVLPKTGGKVVSVNVNVGDKVTEGQVLYTLDKEESEANLQSQKAGLESAKADLEKTSDSSQAQQISQAEQTYGKAQVELNNTEDNYNKMQKLYGTGAISKKDLDDAKKQYDNASIDLKSAKDNLDIIENKIGPQSTKSAAARVAQSEAGVSTAQIQLNNATITSPISGIVSEKDVEVGKIASSQSGSVTVIDSSTLTAEITVPDSMVGKIKVGEAVPIYINALDNKIVNGVIDTISPAANSKDKCYSVKAKIDNANGDLKAGMFVKVSLQSDSKDNVLSVPNQAIKTENGVNYVYLVENNKIKKIAVNTGISNAKFTEVSGNISQTADIITEGQSILADGEKVNVIK